MRQTRVAWRKPRPSPHIRVKGLGPLSSFSDNRSRLWRPKNSLEEIPLGQEVRNGPASPESRFVSSFCFPFSLVFPGVPKKES